MSQGVSARAKRWLQELRCDYRSKAQRFQIADSPNRVILTPPKLNSALLFVCLMIQQKQNLFLISHGEYFKIGGVQKTEYVFFHLQFLVFPRPNIEKYVY